MSEQWMSVLADACAEASQATVARRLGVSAAMVNQVLRGRYAGRIDTLRARVHGALMGQTVDCPVLGEIPTNECLDHQSRPFAATNPQRVRLYRACRTCPHNQQNHGGD